jgi:hypothetical protein
VAVHGSGRVVIVTRTGRRKGSVRVGPGPHGIVAVAPRLERRSPTARAQRCPH